MWVDLGKLIVATGFGMVAQSAKNRQSGHTASKQAVLKCSPPDINDL